MEAGIEEKCFCTQKDCYGKGKLKSVFIEIICEQAWEQMVVVAVA